MEEVTLAWIEEKQPDTGRRDPTAVQTDRKMPVKVRRQIAE